MTDEPRRLVLWGVGTSRTLRAHWALHELGLDYECRPILPRTGETKTPQYTELNPRQKIPLLQDGDFTIAESPAIAAYLSNTYGTPENTLIPPDPREQASWLEWCFYAATQPLRHAPPRRPEARLWRSPCCTGKCGRLFHDAAAACGASAAGRSAVPGRWTVYYRRHAGYHLPDLGGGLSSAGHGGVSDLYEEDHLSARLPHQCHGQHPEDGIAGSDRRLLLGHAASGWEIRVPRQMSRAFGAGPGMHMDLLRRKRLAAFGAHHHRIEILAAEIVGVYQRPSLLSRHVDIAPVDDRHDDRVEVEPLRRQAILITHRPLLVRHLGEHKFVDEFFEAAGEDRSGDAQTLLEILEPPYAQETVP